MHSSSTCYSGLIFSFLLSTVSRASVILTVEFQDRRENRRSRRLMRDLVDAVKKNQQYQTATSVAVNFIFDMCSTNLGCRQWLSDHLYDHSWMYVST